MSLNVIGDVKNLRLDVISISANISVSKLVIPGRNSILLYLIIYKRSKSAVISLSVKV